MDVMNSNASDRVNKKKFKSPACNSNISRFSLEIYFIWFGALIFLTETFIGKLLGLWMRCDSMDTAHIEQKKLNDEVTNKIAAFSDLYSLQSSI